MSGGDTRLSTIFKLREKHPDDNFEAKKTQIGDSQIRRIGYHQGSFECTLPVLQFETVSGDSVTLGSGQYVEFEINKHVDLMQGCIAKVHLKFDAYGVKKRDNDKIMFEVINLSFRDKCGAIIDTMSSHTDEQVRLMIERMAGRCQLLKSHETIEMLAEHE